MPSIPLNIPVFIVNKETGLALEEDPASRNYATPHVLAQALKFSGEGKPLLPNGWTTQAWLITRTPEIRGMVRYMIQNYRSKRYLDLDHGSTANGTNVDTMINDNNFMTIPDEVPVGTRPKTYKMNHMWDIIQGPDGVSLRSFYTGTYVDGGNINVGAPIVANQPSYNQTQAFTIHKVSTL